jgi:hypothetical protein
MRCTMTITNEINYILILLVSIITLYFYLSVFLTYKTTIFLKATLTFSISYYSSGCGK